MSFLDRLRGRRDPAAQNIGIKVEHIIALEPHLRMAKRCQARLTPAITQSLDYFDRLLATLPAAHEASAAAWATDPYIRAFFARPEDVAQMISRSDYLREHFESNQDSQEVYAVLGMDMKERHILGVGLEGETLRRDVPQTTLNFTDHQVRMCGRTEAELKEDIKERMLEQLALDGMERAAADKTRRDELQKERALLKTRRVLLEYRGTGVRGMLGDGDAAKSEKTEEKARLEAEIEENARDIEGLGLPSDAFDRELELMCDMFSHPDQHVYLWKKNVKLDSNNVVIEGSGTQVGTEVEFNFAHVPYVPPRTRAFALIRFSRRDLLPAKSMLDEASRLLASGTLS